MPAETHHNQDKQLLPEVFEQFMQDVWDVREKAELARAIEQEDELLDEIAPRFFGSVLDALISSAIIGIGRIFDSPGQQGRESVSLDWLIESKTISISLEMRRRIDCLVSTIKPIKLYRNKHIAHTDLDTMKGQAPVVSITRDNFYGSIDEACRIANEISMSNFDKERSMDIWPSCIQLKRIIDLLGRGNEALQNDSGAG